MSKKSFLEFITESKLSTAEKELVQEAWELEKQTMASEMRDEFAQRFNEDKVKIVEGIQEMTDEVIQEEMNKLYTEKQKLAEDRVTIRSKLSEFANFSNGVLAEEVNEMRADRVALGESLKKFAQYSNNIIAEEIQEFRGEKQQLVETRVKLLAEGKQKINEAKDRFIRRASVQAATFVQEQTKSEITELKDQINEANSNMFGRKIFEAFATEFMGTQYRESSVLRKLNESIDSLKQEKDNVELINNLLESEVEESRKKIRIMESSQERDNIMGELLNPLTKSQRNIMEGLLQKTPNAMLKEGYNKYLSAVLKQEGKPTTRTANREQLTESTVVTGNRKELIQESFETSEIDAEFEAELTKITNLAGFRK